MEWRVAVVEQHSGEVLLGLRAKGASASDGGMSGSHGVGSSLGGKTSGEARGGGGGVEWWRVAVVGQHIGEALLGSWEREASDGSEGGSHGVGSSLCKFCSVLMDLNTPRT